MALVQGDQSPTYYDSSPGGSIPHHPSLLSWGIKDPLILHGMSRINKKSFKPSAPRALVQGDQSLTTEIACPQGLEKQNIHSPPTEQLAQGDQYPTYYTSSTGGSISHLLGAKSRVEGDRNRNLQALTRNLPGRRLPG